MLRSKKKALFLSIEVTSVLIILAAIMTFIGVAGVRAFRSYKVQVIVSEYSLYSRAILNFASTYGFYPGDIHPNQMVGGLNLNSIKTSAANLFSCSLNSGKYTCPIPTSYSDNFITPHTSSIDGRKSQLVFAQLAAGGFISSGVETNSILPPGCNPYSNGIAGSFVPKSGFASNIIWTFGMDSNNQNPATNNSPIGGIIYNNELYSSLGASKGRLILSRFSQNNSCQVSTMSGQTADMPPFVASILDMKMDDGIPSSINGMLIGENYTESGTQNSGCTILPSGLSNIPQNYIYSNNNTESPTYGCILTFVLQNTK